MYDPEAGRSGLYTSLLERLHTLYMSQGKGSALREEYIASLFTNYRCDAGKMYWSAYNSFYKDMISPYIM